MHYQDAINFIIKTPFTFFLKGLGWVRLRARGGKMGNRILYRMRDRDTHYNALPRCLRKCKYAVSQESSIYALTAVLVLLL